MHYPGYIGYVERRKRIEEGMMKCKEKQKNEGEINEKDASA